ESGPVVVSSAVSLSLGWTSLDLDYASRFAGSTIDLEIVSEPALVGTAFRVDDISILAGGAAGLAGVNPHSLDPGITAPGVHPNPMRSSGARIAFSTTRPRATRVPSFDLAPRSDRTRY